MKNTTLQSMPVWLRLGRVSNLPTVISNVLAAAMLGAAAGGRLPFIAADLPRLLALMLAMSLLYVAGMYLNDAFDREIDARERPHRPIPAGEVQSMTVFLCGFGMLLGGLLLLALYGNWQSRIYGGLLAGMIVLYNCWHKGNLCSPLLMGMCRALLYLCVGSAFADGSPPLLCLASALMLAHIVGLSHAAKQESLNQIGALWPLAVLGLAPLVYVLMALTQVQDADTPGGFAATWPNLALTLLMMALLLAAMVSAVSRLLSRNTPGAVGQAVAQMIAAASLVDGLALAAGLSQPALVAILVCTAAYGATRLLQAVIPGT